MFGSRLALLAALPVAAFLFAWPAHAQFRDCGRAGSNVDIGNCLGQELERADRAIAQIIQRRVREAGAANEMPVAERRAWQRQITAAQRAFVAYREAECANEDYAFWGGTGAGAAALSCSLEITRARLRHLQPRGQ